MRPCVSLKQTVLFVVLLIADANAQQHSHGYTHEVTWPKPAASAKLGQVVGVATANNKRIYVFHRAERTWTNPLPKTRITGHTIAILDSRSGRLLSEFGSNLFVMPHGLSVDNDGFLWVTDAGSHQVFKLNPKSGQVLLTLGTADEPGNDRTHFARPTDIGFAKDGTVFVSDGYINTRVVKFSAKGEYLGEWGTPGTGAGEFNLPHGISVQGNRVYVCDRSNLRVQVFDLMGEFIEQQQSAQIGRPFGIATNPSGQVFIIDGGDQPDNTRSRVSVLNKDGTLANTFSARLPNESKNLGHDIAVDIAGAIYVADAWSNSIRKFAPSKP